MVSAREVGDNSELFDEIHALPNLSRSAQFSLARDWSNRSWDNDDASTLVITLASLHHWPLLPQLWHNKVIRNTLWLIIDEIARYALHNNETQSLVHALPAELRKVEWDLALNFAIKEQSSELLHIFLSKKAKPSFKMIDALSNLYNLKGGEFYKEALSLLIRKVPWQQCLGFRSFDDWQDVIKRGQHQDNPSLFVIASAIMSSKDKIKFLSEAANNEKTAKVVKHMYLPKSALAKASPFNKEAIFNEGFGFMNIIGSDFRLSKLAQRRWQDYPELDSIILKFFDCMLNSVAREKQLDINLIQQLNHAVLSDASSNYSVRALSSILNRLHADLKEFISFLEVKFKVEDGYDFLSARMECDYFDNIKSYDQVFSSMPIDQVFNFYLTALESDISKNSLNAIRECVRLRSFSNNEKDKLFNEFLYIVKIAPEVFHDIKKSEVINNSLLKEVIVDASLDVDFELTETEFLLLGRILNMYSKSLSGFFIEKINEIGNRTEAEKKDLLRFIINDRLGVDLIDISDFISEMVSISNNPLGDQYKWAQEMACSHLLNKNSHWPYYYFPQAAIVYNACQNPVDAVMAFINAADRESILDESDFKESITLEYKDRNEVTLLYPPLCKFIFELLLTSRGMIGSLKDAQERAILYSIATKTQHKFFEAYLKAYSNAISIARFDNHRQKINNLFQMAKDRFDFPMEKLSPASRRIVIESELSI